MEAFVEEMLKDLALGDRATDKRTEAGAATPRRLRQPLKVCPLIER